VLLLTLAQMSFFCIALLVDNELAILTSDKIFRLHIGAAE